MSQPTAPGQPPYRRTPTPPTDRWFTNEGTLANVLSAVVALTAGWAVFVTVSQWHSLRVAKRYAADPARDLSEGERADQIATVSYIGYALLLTTVAVLLIVWLWRVRWNSELFCEAEHSRARGWVIGGWFCPGVNLWFPKQLVDDVLVASDPRTPARRQTLDGLRPPAAVWGWWLAWLFAAGTGQFAWVILAGGDPPDELVAVAVLATFSGAGVIVSAAYLVFVIRLVGELQTKRPWTPWWSTEDGRRVTDR